MSYQQDPIERRAEELATVVLRYRRATSGDRFATAREMKAHLADPMAYFSWNGADAIRGLALEDIRQSVDRTDAMLVRAFLRRLEEILHADRLGEDWDSLFGYTPIRRPRPYYDDPRVIQLLGRLRLSITRLEAVLEAWTSVEAHKGPTFATPRCHTYLTLLTEGD